MKRPPLGATAILLAAVVPACANRQPVPVVQMIHVPPRIDLAQHEMIGVMPIVTPSRGELGPLTTRRLMEWARRDQGIVRMMELGSASGAPRPDEEGRWDPEAIKAFSRRHGLRTILAGEITVSDVRPDVRIASMRSGSISALVDVSLHVQLIEASTGCIDLEQLGSCDAERGARQRPEREDLHLRRERSRERLPRPRRYPRRGSDEGL